MLWVIASPDSASGFLIASSIEGKSAYFDLKKGLFASFFTTSILFLNVAREAQSDFIIS
jgi:hypothetical protein